MRPPRTDILHDTQGDLAHLCRRRVKGRGREEGTEEGGGERDEKRNEKGERQDQQTDLNEQII